MIFLKSMTGTQLTEIMTTMVQIKKITTIMGMVLKKKGTMIMTMDPARQLELLKQSLKLMKKKDLSFL